MIKKLPIILAAVATAFVTLSFSACEKEGPMERAGEEIDDAAEDTTDAVEDATN